MTRRIVQIRPTESWDLQRMTAPITLPPVDTATLAELRRRYEDTLNVESRTRYQMLLLAQQDYKVPQIARIVLRSEDTVARVLKRFLAGGLDAVPRRTPPGRERRVTAARARRVVVLQKIREECDGREASPLAQLRRPFQIGRR
jgi:transposase